MKKGTATRTQTFIPEYVISAKAARGIPKCQIPMILPNKAKTMKIGSPIKSRANIIPITK
jgi:hypothetical protein